MAKEREREREEALRPATAVFESMIPEEPRVVQLKCGENPFYTDRLPGQPYPLELRRL